MENGNVRIVSDGTPFGTKVLVNGEEIRHLARVEILPVMPNGGAVKAVIEVIGPDVDMVAKLVQPAETVNVVIDTQAATVALNNALISLAKDLEDGEPEFAARLRRIAQTGGNPI